MRPHLKIRPARGWQPLDLAQLWRFRDLFWELALRDVKLRYRQTALGAAWVIFQPLMGAGIFSLVFGIVAKLDAHGVPYFLFSYAGLLGWNAFSNTLTKACGSLVSNSGLVSKVFFPRLLLPLSTLVATLIDFAVALAMLLVLLPFYHRAPGLPLLTLPLWLLLLMALATGAGLLCGSLAVRFRDVMHMLPVGVNLLLYASPIAYAVAAVPEHLRGWMWLNPLAPIIEGLRWSLLGIAPVPAGYVAYAAGVAAALLLGGAFAFKRLERDFADVI